MKIGQQVIVSAAVTGDGEHHRGTIADIYEFMRETFVEVIFDHIAADGRHGVIVSNPKLLEEFE